jgi:molybdate transport system permease protein
MPIDPDRRSAGPDWPFWVVVGTVTGAYSIFILSLLAVDAAWTSPQQIVDSLYSREIAFSIRLSLITSTTAALLALLVAIPAGYVLSRTNFRGKSFVDVLVDIPIVLPPLVIGLSLLILFRVRLPFTGDPPLRLNDVIPLTYTVGGVILAQFVIGAAFAVRTMRATFDHLPRRPEDVARVLGCSRAEAVWRVVLPSARRGMVTAFTLAWARSLGEFGPILVFAGATRMRTEVMPTTVFLELSVGNLEPALAVSLLMVIVSVFVLLVVRWTGDGTGGTHDRM